MTLLRTVLALLAFPALVWGADCQSDGPRRSLTPQYTIACIFLADTATGTGVRLTCTDQILENVDEWYFFVSEDEGATNYVIDIENFFEEDDDPTIICQLTDENPECRWLRRLDGNLHKSLRANITTAAGPPTDLDVQVCMTRYIGQ